MKSLIRHAPSHIPRHPSPVPEIPAGRCYLCIGPLCWAKAFTPHEAERNAKTRFSPRQSGTWMFLIFDAPPDATVGGLGEIIWTPGLYNQADADHPAPLYTGIGYPAKELYRYMGRTKGTKASKAKRSVTV